jgi:HK97 gp10 family phage protein
MSVEWVHIDGLAQLNKQLQELPANIEANILRGALRAGALKIQGEALRLVPQKEGALKKSIRIKTGKKRNGRVFTYIVAGTRKPKKTVVDGVVSYQNPFYAHMVEFGTARHLIRPKNKKSLFFAGLSSTLVVHPGAFAKPFMRPAFDGKWEEALNTVADYIRTRLPKEFKKAGK